MNKIYLNGKETEVKKDLSVKEFISSQGLDNKMIAVAINMKIIHKNEYNKTVIYEGDKIEIVRPVGGG
ncbi:MAG: sulfur carrier protein ThiS [Dehalococcoidia bacterium]|jgi:sulfur carrier protein|nr:thiamine biosynthesis protein ThiS [Chloroflexota bacterium]OUW96359.1 MAG: thiamine biosynthesis protein ThiS [Chloroflexi bacterium TMED230]RZP13259.1 MAG: sulfur carrier protein ThiS [Chloroflexota bacterium]|tara:strand:+ start:26775 stop:26978 length:204 start_codon:yes stop_codon:yes gene_type:complete